MVDDNERLHQLRAAIEDLETLSMDEYGVSLTELLADSSRRQEERLWRLGRLVGVAVKEPFATSTEILSSKSETGARRAWELDPQLREHPELFQRPAEDLWQYELVAELLSDRDLRSSTWLGPDPGSEAWAFITISNVSGKFPDDLADRLQSNLHVDVNAAEVAAQHIQQHIETKVPTVEEMTDWLWEDLGAQLQSPWNVAIAMLEMINERGFWRCMAKSAAKFMCGDRRLQEAVQKSASTGGVAGGTLSPQALIGAGSLAASDALTNVVPWMNTSTAIVTTGFLIILGNVGLNGFCDWVAQYDIIEPERVGIED